MKNAKKFLSDKMGRVEGFGKMNEDISRYVSEGNLNPEPIKKEMARMTYPRNENQSIVENFHNDSIETSLYSISIRGENVFPELRKNHRRFYFGDHQIIQDVEESIELEPALAEVFDTIQVNVEDGIVTLDGAVYTTRQKRIAEDTAAGVVGYGKVNNYLIVLND